MKISIWGDILVAGDILGLLGVVVAMIGFAVGMHIRISGRLGRSKTFDLSNNPERIRADQNLRYHHRA